MVLSNVISFIDYFIPIIKFKKKLQTFFFNASGENKVYLIKNGKRRRVRTNGLILGLNIVFLGTNNLVEIEEPYLFDDVTFVVSGDNNVVSIKRNAAVRAFYLNIGAGAKCMIGENFNCVHDGRVYLGGQASLFVGDNCLFSRQICIYAGDGHAIYDKNTSAPLNTIYKPVEIGDNIWIGDDVTILKNVTIASGSVIGAKSLVNKEFTEENILIAGNPAEIKKREIEWKI